MKILSAALALAFLAAPGTELVTSYRSDAVLRFTANTTITTEVVDFRMERDGEPIEGRGGRMAGGSELEEQVVWVDEVLAAVDGAPTELRRTFETLSRVRSSERGDDESDAPLAGTTLLLTLDGDGELRVELVDGAVDDELLEGHRMRLPLDALLPDDEVEPGDEWDLDGERVRTALGITLDRVLFPPGDEPRRGEGDREGRRGGRGGPRGGRVAQLLGEADWEGRAKLVDGEEEVDGHACRVIELELSASATVEREGRRGRGGFRAEPGTAIPDTTIELEADWKGTLAFSVEERRPVALEVEGSFSSETESEMVRGDSTITIFRREEGTYVHTVQIDTEG